MSKFVIIGSGALGSAFANILIDAGQTDLCVYGIDETELADLRQGYNQKYFGSEIKFHPIKTSNNLAAILKDAAYVVLAIPSVVIEQILATIKKEINQPIVIINGCKGFYPNSEISIHTGIEKQIQAHPLIRGCVSIVGPSFAREMIVKALTTICAVSHDLSLATEVQKIFYTPYFKLYTQTDVVGAEVGGIYKNILAIGAGMLTRLGYQINTLAAFLTRGLHEMQTFNQFMGGEFATIYGLTGLGDLILSATDKKSRNFSFGFDYANNKEIMLQYKVGQTTLEGLFALQVVEKLRQKHQLYLPIAEAIYQILFHGQAIEAEILKLWSRDLRAEKA